MTPWRYNDFKSIILSHHRLSPWAISLKWVPQNTIDNKSTLVQVTVNIRQWAIARAIVEPDQCRPLALLGYDELNLAGEFRDEKGNGCQNSNRRRLIGLSEARSHDLLIDSPMHYHWTFLANLGRLSLTNLTEDQWASLSNPGDKMVFQTMDCLTLRDWLFD